MRPSTTWSVSAWTIVGAAGALGAAPQRRADGGLEFSGNVSNCPGYHVGSVAESNLGLTAHLYLGGEECNAFGRDISNLTLEVVYEAENRLHVHVYDSHQQQFQIPSNIFPIVGTDPASSGSSKSSLIFSYQPAPFAFWITRKSDGEALFDTRRSSLAPVKEPAVGLTTNGTLTAAESFPLVFEDQYLQITSAVPENANIYGLGEYVSSSGFRRDPNNTVQTFWARDSGNPVNQNEYGIHPVYFEHRIRDSKGATHGVFLKNSHGMDVLLRPSMVEYRILGGTLDFYFVAGPAPKNAIEQYVQVVGLPQMQPYWSFGFHLCRWGYDNVSDNREVVRRMREANIPLETQWNDIDYMLAYQNFRLASDKSQRFPVAEMKAYINELHENHQHYVMIIDAGTHKIDPNNATDEYDVYTRGAELDVFLKNPDGTEYIGRVWPGYTVFTDWFSENADKWWAEAFRNFSQNEVDFDGVWLDMNEPSSFCEGSCGTGANFSDVDPGITLPGLPGNLVTAYPEGYNSTFAGPSGNISVNGTLTYGLTGLIGSNAGNPSAEGVERGLLELQPARRDIVFLPVGIETPNGTAMPLDIPVERLNTPAYEIHNGAGPLSKNTVAVNATHANGLLEYQVHNLWGHMEELSTNKALRELHPNKRPFVVARSTFAGSGRRSAHWLGDNFSTFSSMWTSLHGVLQFQAFGIPMVGPDTAGFNGNTDEELANRWMQLSAFFPFYRNHNTKSALSQEPYRWDSVAEASRKAIKIRYSLLPYFYSEMAKASLYGTPAIRALWWDFPADESLLNVSEQFMFGSGLLVTPVLEPNVTTVKGALPGNGTLWRDWYTHETSEGQPGRNITMDAPLSHINLHIKGGSIFLQHARPSYTVHETQQGPYALLVALDGAGAAGARVYADDGSSPSSPHSWLGFAADRSAVRGSAAGEYRVAQPLTDVTVLGVRPEPRRVAFGGRAVGSYLYNATVERLTVSGLAADLNSKWTLEWS